jgi:hypothetical protein
MARKPYTQKRAQYLKKRARQYGSPEPPAEPQPRYRHYQPLVHRGRLTDAQLRALHCIADDLGV